MKPAKYDMVIKNGLVIDPAIGFGHEADLFIKDGKISQIIKLSDVSKKDLAAIPAENIIDAAGRLVVPG